MKVSMATGGIQTRSKMLALALGLLTLLVAGGPSASHASAAGPCNKWGDKPSDQITTDEARKAILCLLNRERQSRGIRSLDRSGSLEKSSQRHNDYMQEHNCFSHQCDGEAALSSRLKSAGWLTKGLSRWLYGENVGVAAGSSGTPEALVKAWMDSEGHRTNILNSKFDEVGIGFSTGTVSSPNAPGIVVTTDFGFKR